jgi:hypothetical protein
MPEENKTDHDILTTLVANVSFLKDSQDNFHREMKDSFKELKDNYADRLSRVERGLSDADKVYIAKVEQDKRDAAIDKRLSWLEKIAYSGLGVVACIEILFKYFGK